METNNRKNVYNLIIIDESGSMASIYYETLSAINETINTIRKNQEEYPEQRQFLSIISFEGSGMTGVKVRRDRQAIEKVKDFTKEDYRPCGCTPLYDAMGKSITDLDSCISSDDIAMVTVITDGYENSSSEYSDQAIQKLVSRQREKGWTFAYIGANQDAIEVAKSLRISNALNFDATSEGVCKMSVKYRNACRTFANNVSFSIRKDAAPRSFENLFDSEESEI